MPNYNKAISATACRIGEVRFSYAHVLAPRVGDDGKERYSVQILFPKTDTAAKKLVDACVEAAKQAGVSAKWNGKMPPASKLKLPLRDGDEEFPEDPTYAGMWFFNASTSAEHKPGVRVLTDGQLVEALDGDDFYSGCYGAVAVNFYSFNTSGNMGVACGLNNIVKTRDGERLGGTVQSADEAFADLAGGSCLD